uniref:Uncharacterized protein n=1 Tax=Anopheles minimus TaxID=112268 RepID=A0A182WP15_9DIPT
MVNAKVMWRRNEPALPVSETYLACILCHCCIAYIFSLGERPQHWVEQQPLASGRHHACEKKMLGNWVLRV